MTFARAPGAGVAQRTSPGSVNHPDAEAKPYVAADPADSQHLVAVFSQDRWNDGGDNGNITDVSENGGKSRTLATTQPAFTICKGAARVVEFLRPGI